MRPLSRRNRTRRLKLARLMSPLREAREHWLQFRDARVHQRMTDWLAAQGVEAESE
jgi:hypothetical protein